MKVFGIVLFLTVASFVAAQRIPNHPICAAIMNNYYHSFADDLDCKCFYKCDWADAVRFCCPKDNQTPNQDGYLVFNPTIQVCDRKPAAEAAGAICPSSVPSSTIPVSSSTTPLSSSTTPKPTSTTPSGCITPTTTAATTTTASNRNGCAYRENECPAQNQYYHSYKHETCDNKWCQCDWGKAILQPCPRAQPANGNSLIFNDILQVCDYQKSGQTYNIC